MAGKFGGMRVSVGKSKFGGVPVGEAGSKFGGAPVIQADAISGASNGFIDRVGNDIQERTKTVGDFIDRQEHPLVKIPAIGAIAFGQAAGGIGDIIGEAISSGYSSLPEDTRDYIKNKLIDFSQTKVGKLGLAAIEKGGDAYNYFEKNNPDAALALGSMLNIFGMSVGTKIGGKAIKLSAKEIVDMGDDFLTIAERRFPPKIEKNLVPVVQKKIEKAIRPSVSKMGSANVSKAYFHDATEAVKTIIDNKSTLGLTDDLGKPVPGLPKNLKQFSEAIANTKKDIFRQYDRIAKLSGQQGAAVDTTNIINELSTISKNRGMLSDVRQYAEEQILELTKIGQFTSEEAQTRIQALNNRMGSIKDYNSAAKASVDSLIANNLRAELNNIIEKTTGEQYGVLKKKYGALKTIEKDVTHRAMVDARKNIKGLIDYTDVFTGAEVISGVMTMNPTLITKGLAGKTLASVIKYKNNPDKMVEAMFNSVEKIMEHGEKLNGKFKPKSYLVNKIKK